MKTFSNLLLTLPLAHVFSLATCQADTDWPNWRGPTHNGCASAEAKPPTTWAEGSHVKWKFQTPGAGTSSPIVSGDKVFLTMALKTDRKAPAQVTIINGNGEGVREPELSPFVQAPPPPPAAGPGQGGPGGPGGRRRFGPGGGGGGGGFGRGEAPTQVHEFYVLCVNRADGKELWRKKVNELVPHEGHHQDHGFASASCVTDGKLLFAFFGSRGLYCLDFQGNVKWEKDLGDMKVKAGFGEGASPALHGDTLVVNWDHEGDDFLTALNKETGKEIWRKPRQEETTWTTPLIVEVAGKQPQVVVAASGRTRSYDLATGEEVWARGGMTANVIPTPVVGFGNVYAISGFRGAALQAIKLGQTGDLTEKAESLSWSHNDRTPYVPSPALSGSRLYFFAGNNATLSCLDAQTGKPFYAAERIEGVNGVYASPVAADGKIFVVGRDGNTAVLKDGDKLEVLATNKLDDKFDASPALAGKELFLRGHQFLYCLAE